MNELTETSAPGVYVVRTASGSTYEATLSAVHPPRVVRFNPTRQLPGEGEAMPLVTALWFTVGRRGSIWWWRDPDEREPWCRDAPYIGTFRITSTVMRIELAATG